MFNVSAVLLDDALLECVVTEVVLFSVVAFQTLTFYWVVSDKLEARCYLCTVKNFLMIPTVKTVWKLVII